MSTVGTRAAQNQRACKLCGKRIAVLPDESGRSHPLDLVAPVYRVFGTQQGEQPQHVARANGVYVSHFSTCPKAHEALRRGKAGAAGDADPASPSSAPDASQARPTTQ